jgi:hypothetical protein
MKNVRELISFISIELFKYDCLIASENSKKNDPNKKNM